VDRDVDQTLAPPATLDRARLAAVLGMCGSDFEGEALNAARLADRLVREAGLTWEAIVAADPVLLKAANQLLIENEELRAELDRLRKEVRPRPPQPWGGADGWQDGVQALLLWHEHLSQWDRDFLNSLLLRCRRLSPKQYAVLARIGDRVDRLIRASWGASP
jgi:hypothetical protein